MSPCTVGGRPVGSQWLASSRRPVVAPDPKRPPPEGLGYVGLVKLVACDGRTKSCRNEAVHLAGEGMSIEGRLREEQLAIERHLETAAAAWQQHRPGDPRRPPGEELSHQTGGSIRVVSDDAELDLECVRSVGRLWIHAGTLPRDACRRRTPHDPRIVSP